MHFRLMSKVDCPLCDEMKQAFSEWAAATASNATLSVVDIETDTELKRRFAWRIPVLMLAEQEICAGHFDAEAASRAGQ